MKKKLLIFTIIFSFLISALNIKSFAGVYEDKIKSQVFDIECVDVLTDLNTGIVTKKTLDTKDYKYGNTVKGSDWGTDSPYEGYVYIDDTTLNLEPETIPDSAFVDNTDYTKMNMRLDEENMQFDTIINNWTVIGAPGWYATDDNGIIMSILGAHQRNAQGHIYNTIYALGANNYRNYNWINSQGQGINIYDEEGQPLIGKKLMYAVSKQQNMYKNVWGTGITAGWTSAILSEDYGDVENLRVSFDVSNNSNLHNGFCFNVSRRDNPSITADGGNEDNLTGYFFNLTQHYDAGGSAIFYNGNSTMYIDPEIDAVSTPAVNNSGGPNMNTWSKDGYGASSSLASGGNMNFPNKLYYVTDADFDCAFGVSGGCNAVINPSTTIASWTSPRTCQQYFSDKAVNHYDVDVLDGHVKIVLGGHRTAIEDGWNIEGGRTVAEFDIPNGYNKKGSFGFYGINCERACSMKISNFKMLGTRNYLDYRLRVNPNGGSYKGQTDSVIFDTNDKNKVVELAIPVREGYKFAGWAKSSDFKGVLSYDDGKFKYTYDENYKYSSTDHVDSLVAQWIPNKVERHFYSNISVNCVDMYENTSNNTKEYVTLSSKTYKYGDTVKGSDWGKNSTKANYSYISDTQITLKPQSIPESAYNISPDAVAKMEKIALFDSNTFSADDIYNSWDMFPNPNATTVFDGHILNDMNWTFPAQGGLGRTGHEQAFLYGNSEGHDYIEISADIMNHGCQAPSGLVVNYNKDTNTAYVVVCGDAYQYSAKEYCYTRLYKVTNFTNIIDTTNFLADSNPYSTCVAEVPTKNFGIPQVTFNKTGAYWFNRFGDQYHNMTAIIEKDGHLTVNINNQKAIEYDLPANDHNGRVGFLFQCIGIAKNVGVVEKSEKTIVTNGLVINPNGGTYEGSNKTSVYVAGKAGSTITLEMPTRAGYTFAGWSKNNKFRGKLYAENGKFVYKYANFANIDAIVATWIPNTVTRYFKSNYKVNFDGNQATSGSINTMTCNYGANYNIPENNFERTGYIFKEFNTKKDGTGTSYKVGQSFKNISNGKSEITLYAIWTPIKYYVLYDRNGAQDGTLPFDTVAYDTDYIARENIFEWEHFEFQSWNTMPDGSGRTILENEAVKNLCNTDNDSITLYAQWKITDNVKKYTLTVKPNKGEFEGSKLDKQFYYIPDPSAVTTFGYSRSVQTYTVPSTGYYFLEAYGAKGGNDACPGGFGGYVKSFVKLEKGTVLYIQTGEAGYTVHGADACRYGDLTPTYGGGGLAGRTGDNGNWSGVGGGATSISTALYGNGELESYVNHRDDILVVAGGGGGGSASNRGIGGQVLYAGSGTNYYIVNGTSASLLRGDHHPNGQDAGGHDGGGGGGGFIGGVCGWDSGVGRTSGGGASFINSNRGCYSYALTPDACAGHGYVKISKFDTSGIKILEDPTRLGYTFDTWKNYGDGKLEHEKASNLYIVDFSKNDTTVEAQWIPNTYYVIYKNYDGKGNDFTQTCTYDTPSNYLANTPDLSDSIFIGWFENDNPKDLSDGKIPGGSEFINLTPEPFGKIYVYGKWSKTNENKDTDATKPVFIKTTQIQIDGSNIYKEPTEDKKYFIKNDTEFDLNFNGMIDSDIDVNFLPVITNETSFEVKGKEISITNNDFKFNENLNVSMSNNQNTLNASTEAAAVRKNNSTPGTNKTLLNYKQVFTLSKNKDGELVEINPHSSFNLTRQNETGNYTTIYKTDKTDDKNHNIYVECDATRPTIINDSKIDEKYVETSNNYNPLISEKETITFNYADFIGNVNTSNPKYGSGIKTSNIKLTVTQEQTDKGGNSKTQIYTGDSINSYIKVTALTAHTGKIEIFIDPENYSDMSGFIDFKLEITDNVGNTATKEIRILVLGLQTQVKNTSNGINKGKRTFAQGENGQIIIETNGFADKVDIKFPSSLDSLSSNEKVSGSTDIWETGRTLSDTYPRDASGAEMTVPSKYQTKLWGTTHKGGVQANKDNLESCYLTHYFYAPLYAENNKYETYVTIYKTDPKYPDKTYSVTKKVNVYIGIDEDNNEIAPITDEFRDELKDN